MLKKIPYFIFLLIAALLVGLFLAGCPELNLDDSDHYESAKAPKKTKTPAPTETPAPTPEPTETPEPGTACMAADQMFGSGLTGYVDSIARNPADGTVYISEHHFEERDGAWYNVSGIYKFDSDLSLADTFSGFEPIMDMDTDPGGNLVVVESANHRVKILSPEGGTVIGEFQFEAETPTMGIEVDENGHIHLVGSYYYKKFLPSGTLLTEFDVPSNARDVAYESSTGDVIIVVYMPERVYRYGSDGTLKDEFGTEGEGPGELVRPTKLTVDENGYIYIADAEWRIQKFDGNGIYQCGYYGRNYDVMPIGVVLDPYSDDVYTCNFTQAGGIGAKLTEY